MTLNSVNDIISYAGIVPIAFGLFFVAQLKITEIGKDKSNRHIANYFLVVVFTLVCKYVIDVSLDWAFSYILFFPLLLTLAPALYRYLYFITQQNVQRVKFKQSVVHFLLPLGYLVLNVGSYLVASWFGEDHSLSKSMIEVYYWFNLDAFNYFFAIQNLGYLILVIRDYRNYHESINQISSFKEGLELSWVKTLVISYAVTILSYSVSRLFPSSISLFYPIALVHILYTGFYVIQQNFKLYKTSLHAEFIQSENKVEESKSSETQTEPVEKGAKRYDGSSLKDEDKIEDLKARILTYVEEEKPYLDPNISIYKMGKELDINSKYISQVINQELGINFISFINNYRVEEVKRLLKDPDSQKYTLETLANKSGFKSKSTFNASFKKIEGMTPSAYRKEMTIK